MAHHQLIPLDSPDEWRAALRGIPHAIRPDLGALLCDASNQWAQDLPLLF